MKYKDITGVILAGGRNTRMNGGDKAMLSVDGRAIVERSISTLSEIFEEIIIVSNESREYNYPGVKNIKDIIKDIGPLGGIYTGLTHLRGNAGFFFACDMPFLHNEIILRQIDLFNKIKCAAVVPRIASWLEPLHAIYKTELKDKIFEFIRSSNEYSISRFLEAINTYYWDLDEKYGRSFKNINTPGEFRDLKRKEV